MHHHATALNLSSVLEHQASLTPDRVAITCAGRHMTYARAQCGRRASGRMDWSRSASLPAIMSRCRVPNVPWFPIAYFGILKAGAVVVPLNVLLKPREIAYHLKDSDAKAVARVRGNA